VVVSERLGVLKGMHEGRLRLVVTPVKAFMQRLPAPEQLVAAEASTVISIGDEPGLESLLGRLSAMGYTRTGMVYEPGEFSVRGGILDVYPPGSPLPFRLEFFGDSVDSVRGFDPQTQRSCTNMERVEITPVPSRAGFAPSCALDEYFPGPSVIIVDEPADVFSHAAVFESRVGSSQESFSGEDSPAKGLYMTAGEAESMLTRPGCVRMESLHVESGGGESYRLMARPAASLGLRETGAAPWPEDLPKTADTIFSRNIRSLLPGRSVNVACPTSGRAERLREIFAEHGVPAAENMCRLGPAAPNPVGVLTGELSSGFELMDAGIVFITSRELFGEKPARTAPSPRARAERFLTSLSELSAGDYVVHVEHGIGMYQGLKRLRLMGVESDFLEVLYQGSDRLYVPVAELGKLQKYIGSEGPRIKLDRLGGTTWEKTRSRAKKAVEQMAGELMELYAARSVAPGHAYPPDDHIYREMESAFEYEETPDQKRAIEDVKSDMERPHPMDRLVCGDVGYGKTEVAVRAAFKAAMDGKQTAVLVPTTLLAAQHLETFRSRLAAFPVRVEMLSRFTLKEHVREIISGLGSGVVDIVIGTHRLFSKDVGFHNLGLVVVDEEHRFGVRHKERLKALRKDVDVLTLTATPIPRTLNMSISGIRDLSVIETPPPDRLPIKTVVARFDTSLIKDAILRELERGGQVFFVHNRIESIFAVGEMLQRLVPGARMAVAHGRMREDALDGVVSRFVDGGLDVLVCTSIIESGLDIPAANTIIVNRADMFGLADLYQLRGRVGRAGLRAFAYLLVPGEETLAEAARKRLRVLTELTELGAGFRLALHDLEIRGAGNLLGPEQSGQIAAVGFEMYTRLLEEAVKNLRGEPVEHPVDPALELKVSAFIPEDYVPDTAHRLGVYKRLASAGTSSELMDLKDELEDRYGRLPSAAQRLIEVMELKVLARALNVAGIQAAGPEIKISFTDKVDITPDTLVDFLKSRRKTARYVPQYSLFIKTPSGGWDALYAEIKNCLKELGRI
jgi:transcription-repair coupling factor (superfamily II helicase)